MNLLAAIRFQRPSAFDFSLLANKGGARQVGKSTLIRLFAKQRNLELVELNFERNPEYADLFTSNVSTALVVSAALHAVHGLNSFSSNSLMGRKCLAFAVDRGK